jgi:hypothetical protein
VLKHVQVREENTAARAEGYMGSYPKICFLKAGFELSRQAARIPGYLSE